MLEIIVGGCSDDVHTNSRSFFITRALATKSSSLILSSLHPSHTTIYLSSISPMAFQNYINYCHSSIYSIGRPSPPDRPMHENTLSYLLGSVLKDEDYQRCAFVALYNLMEPLARSMHSKAALSNMRASDVDFACCNSPDGSPLRRLFFDAVASHWTRLEAKVIKDLFNARCNNYNANGAAIRSLAWPDMYRKYVDFRAVIALSALFPDSKRGQLLRHVDEYIGSRKNEEMKKERVK
ncbi:hypothetical protein K504DRAFT_372275 [Pleomassaria siparia CBS 279.74]|uniref:BTB domain-containing protein n=1 Tax=Pleomassaria siparia CBS 279.74 TaxID=1314801 RepID=A0A6G1KIK6_9PLEO|nr:hypothetical protein K504DRAFT_372275 [Pleomassaria siparia CBS 279.74]